MLHNIGVQGWCTNAVLIPIGLGRQSLLTSTGFLLAGRWYMETIPGWVQEEEPSSDSNAETPRDLESVHEFVRVKDGKFLKDSITKRLFLVILRGERCKLCWRFQTELEFTCPGFGDFNDLWRFQEFKECALFGYEPMWTDARFPFRVSMGFG